MKTKTKTKEIKMKKLKELEEMVLGEGYISKGILADRLKVMEEEIEDMVCDSKVLSWWDHKNVIHVDSGD